MCKVVSSVNVQIDSEINTYSGINMYIVADITNDDIFSPSAGHILQDCHEHDALRQTYWPTETTLMTKLHGPLQELQKTARFVQETTLQI
jgi:hypothetical protein